MDSLTQFVLGAAVTRGVSGARSRVVAPLIGGVVGTLPDLDVFVPMGGPVEDFTFHRGASHSLLVLSVAAPLIAWLVHRLYRPPGMTYRRWLLAVWLTLVTHVLLDALTVYGTQLLWPLTEWPFGVGSIFIIDPLFTVPLLLGLVVAMFPMAEPRARLFNTAGLAFGATYLVFGLLAQAHVREFAHASLARQGIAYQQVLPIAAPFSSVAWRVLVVSENAYHVGYHSLLAPNGELRLSSVPRNVELLDAVQERWDVRRLRWFTKGYYAASQVDGGIRISDLRMGVEPDRYAFTFEVARREGDRVSAAPTRRVPPRRFRDGDFRRIFDVYMGAPSL